MVEYDSRNCKNALAALQRGRFKILLISTKSWRELNEKLAVPLMRPIASQFWVDDKTL